jgi:polysaccharide biosynthesis protein PslH
LALRAPLNILILAPEFPFPTLTGGRLRTYHLIRELSKHHRISLLAFSRADPSAAERREVQQYCARVSVVADQGWSGTAERLGSLLRTSPRAATYYDRPGFRRELDCLLGQARFDVLQAETSFLAGPVLRRSGNFKRVVVFLDLNFLLCLRRSRHAGHPAGKLGYLVEALQFLKWERWIARNADAAITVSEKERALLSRISGSARIRVIPNGVDTARLRPTGREASRKCLIFVGSHEHPPNVDAGRYFLERIFPLLRKRMPDIRVLLVGLGGHPEIQARVADGVVAVAPTPQVRAYYAQADFAIAPIRVGAGTRLKILEAMSLGLPVVSTPLGCEGLDVREGEHLLIRTSPSGFADAVIRLYEHPELAARLRQAGRTRVEQRYGWDRISCQLEDLYAGIAGRW